MRDVLPLPPLLQPESGGGSPVSPRLVYHLRDPGAEDTVDALGRIGRKRERLFATHLIKSVARGIPEDVALMTSVLKVYKHIVSPKTALRKAHQLLAQRPWICEALSLAFEGQGFSIEDATAKHVAHIKGEDPDISMRALDLYYKLTVPKPATKVDLRMMAAVDVTSRGGAPQIAARTLEGEVTKDES